MAIKRAIKAGNKSIISFKKAIKVGEITQLLDKSIYAATTTINGVTFTNNGDGTITVNGTTTKAADFLVNKTDNVPIIKNHIYCVLGSPFGGSPRTYSTSTTWGSENGNGIIQKNTRDFITGNYWIHIEPNYTANNLIFTPQVFDLTEMFGAGHEPATVAEFKAKFPETYYPYQRAVLTVYNKVVRPCARKGEVVQLLDKNKYSNTQTKSGITATNNGDGSWTINGTATASDYINFSDPLFLIVGGHKILICGNKENSNFGMGLLNQSIKDTGTGAIGIFNQNAGKYWGIEWKSGAVINNVTITPQLFDLTAMYGAGNEPKTLADFRKDFPESYYPYSPIQTKNLFDIRKYTGLINGQLGNEPGSLFIKNLTQNSLTIRLGVYGNSAYLKEPIVLPAGTYTFSCNCDYDAIYNRGGLRLEVGKKNEDNTRIISIREGAFGRLHRLFLTFTLEEETEVYLSLQGDGGPANYTNLNNVFFNIQLEKGSVATDYVPHDYI